MIYRELGNTRIKVSEIGIGCEGFIDKTADQVREFVDLMEQEGVNCIDLYSPNPVFRSSLGAALAGRREKFVLQAHLCTIWKDGQYKRTRDIEEVKEGFADQLKRLGTDYVQIGMIHYVDSVDEWRNVADGPVMQYARMLKEEGVIKSIGLSSHNPEAALEAIRGGNIDVLMFSIDPCYDLMPASEDVEELWNEKNYEKPLLNMEPARQELYEECQRRGIGITVMKAFGGGDLLDGELSPAGKALNAFQCLSYALTRPAVATVLSGARSLQELKSDIAYESAKEEERDYAPALAAFPKISWAGHCMYCGHCAPCPKGIDVAMVTKLLNLAVAQDGIPETIREHYAVLSHTAGECAACGVCEKRCPFQVKIALNMKKAAELFGK